MSARLVLIGLILSSLFGISPVLGAQGVPDPTRKQARAARVNGDAISIDGRLDESAWQAVPAIADFVQREPAQGEPATDAMEVRIGYDDTALYVAARMSSGGPIQSPLGRRDDADQAEHIIISLDTYLDRRTATSFGVTAAGVRIDYYHTRDDDDAGDTTFNPVWYARTQIGAEGWTAELRIPLNQVRFNEREQQVWGLNIRRWTPSRNEEVYWSPVRRTDERWASLFGDLTGIEGISPRRRVELLPYIASDARVIGNRDPRNPFLSAANLNARVGADAKVGIGSNLTLEAAVDPDFGQVEADPAEVNLSAFETFFTERRPFFVEGANLLTGRVNNYFYSRRIGATPPGRATGEFVDSPRTSTILGAAKLTGRLASGMSIGVLAALTDEEVARTVSGQVTGQTPVAPRTLYGVARIQQEIGRQGSTVGFMATTVNRQLSPGSPLESLLVRQAMTLSGDSLLRLGNYEVLSYLGMTHVGGSPAAVERAQRASAHFLQRPDADYLQFDPLRTSMSGAKGGISIETQNARHWLWEFSTAFESPEFETNDIGRLTAGDGIELNAEVEYRDTTLRRLVREYSVVLAQAQEWNFGGDRQTARVENELGVTWANFWETELTTRVDFRRQDMRLTRGGPSMQRPRNWRTTLEVLGREAAQTRLTAVGSYGRNEDGGLYAQVQAGLTMRPAPQWQLTITPNFIRELETQQYIATQSGGPSATFGGRYIFGVIDRTTHSAQVRLGYTFKPDMNLDFYGEPFAASGRYSGIGALALPRTRQVVPLDRVQAGLGELDFNVRSFRSNLVLRWEWRPGSTLFLVWQQDRTGREVSPERVSLADMFTAFRAPGSSFFAVKASFWFSP